MSTSHPASAPRSSSGAPVWELVSGLPDKQRAAVVLRYRLELSHREIGQVLDCSEAAARRSLHEGLEKLRAHAIEEMI